jgi:hypothetical protein
MNNICENLCPSVSFAVKQERPLIAQMGGFTTEPPKAAAHRRNTKDLYSGACKIVCVNTKNKVEIPKG